MSVCMGYAMSHARASWRFIPPPGETMADFDVTGYVIDFVKSNVTTDDIEGRMVENMKALHDPSKAVIHCDDDLRDFFVMMCSKIQNRPLYNMLVAALTTNERKTLFWTEPRDVRALEQMSSIPRVICYTFLLRYWDATGADEAGRRRSLMAKIVKTIWENKRTATLQPMVQYFKNIGGFPFIEVLQLCMAREIDADAYMRNRDLLSCADPWDILMRLQGSSESRMRVLTSFQRAALIRSIHRRGTTLTAPPWFTTFQWDHLMKIVCELPSNATPLSVTRQLGATFQTLSAFISILIRSAACHAIDAINVVQKSLVIKNKTLGQQENAYWCDLWSKLWVVASQLTDTLQYVNSKVCLFPTVSFIVSCAVYLSAGTQGLVKGD